MTCYPRNGSSSCSLFCSSSCSRLATAPLLPLRRSRDAQSCLLGGGEAAQAHLFATTLHPCVVGLGIAEVGEAHAEVARRVIRPPRAASAPPPAPRLLPRLLTLLPRLADAAAAALLAHAAQPAVLADFAAATLLAAAVPPAMGAGWHSPRLCDPAF
eukprot:scaffold83598_cov69-Phaeocystis_antarctica.AAC.1